jgi:hypothetical protein
MSTRPGASLGDPPPQDPPPPPSEHQHQVSLENVSNEKTNNGAPTRKNSVNMAREKRGKRKER